MPAVASICEHQQTQICSHHTAVALCMVMLHVAAVPAPLRDTPSWYARCVGMHICLSMLAYASLYLTLSFFVHFICACLGIRSLMRCVCCLYMGCYICVAMIMRQGHSSVLTWLHMNIPSWRRWGGQGRDSSAQQLVVSPAVTPYQVGHQHQVGGQCQLLVCSELQAIDSQVICVCSCQVSIPHLVNPCGHESLVLARHMLPMQPAHGHILHALDSSPTG